MDPKNRRIHRYSRLSLKNSSFDCFLGTLLLCGNFTSRFATSFAIGLEGRPNSLQVTDYLEISTPLYKTVEVSLPIKDPFNSTNIDYEIRIAFQEPTNFGEFILLLIINYTTKQLKNYHLSNWFTYCPWQQLVLHILIDKSRSPGDPSIEFIQNFFKCLLLLV